MHVVSDAAGLAAAPPGEPVCVLLDPDDSDLRQALGQPVPEAERLARIRRPVVHQGDDEVVVLAPLALGSNPERVVLVAGADRLLVIGGSRVREQALAAVTRADPHRPGVAEGPGVTGGSGAPTADGPAVALARVLMALAHTADDDLAQLAADRINVDGLLGDDKVVSVATRHQANHDRAMLAEWRQLHADLARLTDRDGELADALGKSAHKSLRAAQATFASCAETADRLYQLLGDVLAQQEALTSQRLTLAATVFLPLTVATGFFGMNFAWLTDRIGSLWSFLVLGVLIPVAAVLLSLGLTRRYRG